MPDAAAPGRLTERSWLVLEGFVVAALVVTAGWYGRFAFLNSAAPPSFYQREFGPAVMVAAGRGFENPIPAEGSAFAEFLAQRRNTLEARDAVPAQVAAPDQFQYGTRYLITVVGYWWRATGVSWAAVADVAAALHVVAVLGAYATLRLFMPLVPSVLGALWICTSTLQLGFVTDVRDYSQGAFMLAIIPLIVMLALRLRSQTRLLAVAGAAGAAIGIGLGFKMDVAIAAPIAVACILLFRGRRPWTALAEKARAIAVLTCALLVAGYPVLSRLSTGGSNGFHVILLGYADQFDANLGIERSVYRFFPYYSDVYLTNVIRARELVQGGRWLGVPSVEYDRVSRETWTGILRHFPADAFARGLAATNVVLNLAFANPAPAFLSRPPPASTLFNRVYLWLYRWNDWGAALGAMLIVLASLSSPRMGALAAFLLLALGGYPSLLFGARDYFHLQVIPVLALLVLASVVAAVPFWIARVIRSRSKRVFRVREWRTVLPKLAVAAIVIVMTVLPLGVLRAYQSRHIDHLLSGFLEGPRTRLNAEVVEQENRLWLVRWPKGIERRSAIGRLSWAYYVVEFRGEGPPSPMAMRLRYAVSTPAYDPCPRVLSMSSRAGVARFGFAVFSTPGENDFEGVELESSALRRLTGIYRMDVGGPAGLPLELRLPGDWRRRHLYQRLKLEGAPDDSAVESAFQSVGCESLRAKRETT